MEIITLDSGAVTLHQKLVIVVCAVQRKVCRSKIFKTVDTIFFCAVIGALRINNNYFTWCLTLQIVQLSLIAQLEIKKHFTEKLIIFLSFHFENKKNVCVRHLSYQTSFSLEKAQAEIMSFCEAFHRLLLSHSLCLSLVFILISTAIIMHVILIS